MGNALNYCAFCDLYKIKCKFMERSITFFTYVFLLILGAVETSSTSVEVQCDACQLQGNTQHQVPVNICVLICAVHF